MSKIRVGINGFGRIGRAIFRNNFERKFFDIVAINEINPDINNILYTLKYDTLYGQFNHELRIEDEFIVDGHENKIAVSHIPSIDKVKWEFRKADFIIDATGVDANVAKAHKLINNKIVRKIFITYCPEGVDFSMVLGANENEVKTDEHNVISSSICDATAIAPVLKNISKTFGIKYGYVTTLHPWLNYQNLMDGPASSWSKPGTIYHHYALGRSVIGNIIPKPTSAITATCKALESENITENIIGSFSYRTPNSIVCSADITLLVNKNITVKNVISLFEEIEKNQRWPIIHNSNEPLVSLDFLKSKYSAVIDHRWTDVINRNMLKLVLWYDNEWGYANRVLDQIKFISGK